MRKLVMLSFSNMRKSKGNTLSLMIMFFIAALLVNAGLLVFINFGSYFADMTSELKTSNVYYIVSSDLYSDELDQYLKSNDNINELQLEETYWAVGKTLSNNEMRVYLLNDASLSRNMTQWTFVGPHLADDEMSVYLPYRYQLNGYELNDSFELLIQDQPMSFTIKGFIEDVYFSSTETGLMGIYFPHDTYTYISSQLSHKNQATLIFANLKQMNKDIETKIKLLTGAENLLTSYSYISQGQSMFSIDLATVKMARTMMAVMVALMVVAFSLIIVSVCSIVIRFKIGNSIEDDIQSIGALKAIGYTSKQIVASITMQFLLIASIGSTIGIACSYLTTPFLSDVFAEQSGLKWVQGFDWKISSISFVSILVIVVLVAFFTSRRINKLNPIVALRGGIITHNFRKNLFPLSITKGNLSIVLAIKNIFQNLKQSLMMMFILIAVTFAGTFAVVMFYNTAIDNKTFLETPGIELSNVAMILNSDLDNSLMIEEIKQQDDVRKVQFIDQYMLKIGEEEIVSFVVDDYSQKETNTIYKGRYPIHNDEVAISGYISSMYHKKIGDNIMITVGDQSKEFLITGLTQGAFALGKSICLRTDSIKMFNPDFKQQDFQIYLKKGSNTESFVNNLDNLYGSSVISIINVDKDMTTGASAYISIVEKVGIAISLITIAVVILVLYFVIHSSIIRRKRELGIQKALGFSTLQLMNQISLNFLFPIMIGISIGTVLGVTQTNPLMSITQRAMGIMKANYIIKPLWMISFGACLTMISYLTSMFIAYRVRHISAYSLIKE